jgi:hypothetical protein
VKRRIIRKWFWVWEFDEEEKWLNDMAKRGWVLDSVGFAKYTFTESVPGEYAVRLEMLGHTPASSEGQDYIDFIEETGAEYLGNVMQWIYFRKKTADGPFDLFSDVDSRIRHLERITKPLGIIALCNVLIGVSNMRLGGVGLINIACAALLGYACMKINRKKDALQKERSLHE